MPPARRASRWPSATSPSGKGASTSGSAGPRRRRPTGRRRAAAPPPPARSRSTRSSSATPAISTCLPHGGRRADGRSSSTRSSRSPTRSSPTAGGSAREACPRGRSPSIDRRGVPLRRPRRRRHRGARGLFAAPAGARQNRGLLRRRRGASLRVRAGAGRTAFTALFVGKLIPLHGLETILAAARLAPELRFRVVGSGQLDAAARRPAAERRARPVGRVRAPAGGAAPRLVRARDLRHVGARRRG